MMQKETSGADLLDQARAAFERYTIQSAGHVYDALALYVAYTHATEAFHYAPRLLLTSAEKRSGKTRTMEIATCLARDPLVAANATVPAIFRSIGDRPRTLFFDEADTIFGTKIKAEQNEDLRGLINAGFQRGTPVLRTVGPTHEPTEFQTFAPVVMAAIGQLPDTIVDRAVNVRLRRRKASERVAPFRASRHEVPLLDLREALAEWIGSNLDELREAEPVTPLEDRAADLWEPLLAVADLAGGTWPARARTAAVAMAREAAEDDAESSTGMELLRDIRQVLELVTGEFVQSTALLTLLTSMEDSRWREDGLTGRRLADLLKPYAIHPRRAPSGNGRGYLVARFTDAFDRYLSTQATEPTDTTETAPSRHSEPVTSSATVTSKRQTPESDSDRNREIATIPPHLPVLSPPPADEGATCACGTPLNDYYRRVGRTACPGHEDLEAAR